MILRTLKLENIRSYINEKIDFPEGSVILSGDIGSGKSTILFGIEFAFFGIMRSGLSGSSLLRHGANKGSVKLSFDIDEDQYIIKRTLKRTPTSVGQDTGYIITNGRKYQGTPVELKARILEILGYPEELITKSKSLIYRYTVYTAQEQIKEILFEDKDKRLDTLRKVFGVDKYKTVRENAVIFIRELKNKKKELKIKLESLDELEKEKKQLIQKQEENRELIHENNKKNQAAKETVEKQKKELDEYEQQLKKYNEIKKDIGLKNLLISTKKASLEKTLKKKNELKSRFEKIQEKISEFQDIKEKKPETELEKELEELEKSYSSLIKEKTSFEQENKHLQEDIIVLEQEIKELTEKSRKTIIIKAEINEIKIRLEEKPKQEKFLHEMIEKDKTYNLLLEKFKVRINQANQLIKIIKTEDICPTCSQEIDDGHRKEVIEREKSNIKNNQKEQEKIQAALEKISSNITKIKKNLDSLIETETRLNKKKQDLARLESSTEQIIQKQKKLNKLYEKRNISKTKDILDETSLKKQIDEKKQILSMIRQNNLKFREKKNILEMIKEQEKNIATLNSEIKSNELEIKTAENERKLLNNALDQYKEINEKYEEQKNQVEEQKEKQKQIEIRLASLNQESKFLNQRISKINEKLDNLEKIKNKIIEFSQIQEWFESLFLKLMTTMEKHIMVSIHKEFNSLLKEWFAILIEDIDIELDDEFSPKIIQDGYETDVESLSGGEKTSVALSYRLALNKVINDLIQNINTKDLIILDEPTDGFSTEQLDKVRDILEELNMKQTIIVSHEAKMESYVENIVRIAKSDNISRVIS